ncbi:MAG: 4Fe-4S dicluster domain-containing protein [Syntrophobacteraceae bacterium]
MIWTEAAEKAIGKVPFFVRKKVRGYVEEEAARAGADRVVIEHVDACRRRFLSGKEMEKEVKGFQIETCFGPSGCENRAVESGRLAAELEKLLAGRNFAGFLKERAGGPLKFHHEFRVSVSECPNACSRPQIVDIGIIGARRPKVSDGPCTGCGACVQICRENAVRLDHAASRPPVLDGRECVQCGKCIGACPAGTISEGARGYRILVGGKLGRHPQLGRELEGTYSMEEVLKTVKRFLDIYFEHNQCGERLGAVLNRTGIHAPGNGRSLSPGRGAAAKRACSE